jgi:copper chaperone CopZ
MQHILTVQNVKCGGCVANIESNLGKLDGVEKVSVDLASGQVTVEGSLDRARLSATLAALGYPEKN